MRRKPHRAEGAPRWRALAPAFLALAACMDDVPRALPTAPPGPPLGPIVAPPDPNAVLVSCRVRVSARLVDCVPADPAAPPGASFDRIIGGQNTYVLLESSGASYDAGTQILQSPVTVQNLTRAAMGTTDGTTLAPTGIRTFFHSGPTVTSGTGTVTVQNADGTAIFLGSTQPYFQYNEILTPLQISAAKTWAFNVPSTVNTFTFAVYVSAPVQNEAQPPLDRVWAGGTSTAWTTAANWQGSAVPDATSAVTIPLASQLAPGANQPALAGNTTVAFLRVGAGSTLSLGGATLTVSGNVDARGTISGGLVSMTGTGTVVGGSLPGLSVAGHTKLQTATTASGAVTIEGTLVADGKPLVITIP